MGNMNLLQKHLNSWRKFENRTICYIIGSSRLSTLYHQLLSNRRLWNFWNNAPLSLLSCFKVNLGQHHKGVWEEMLESSYAGFIFWCLSSFRLGHLQWTQEWPQAQMWCWKGHKAHTPQHLCSHLWILTSLDFSNAALPTSHSWFFHGMWNSLQKDMVREMTARIEMDVRSIF